MSEMTCFGKALDDLARERGKWPADAIVHTLEAVGPDLSPFVILTGGVPIGTRGKGGAKFDQSKQRREFKAVVPLADYRAIFPARSQP